MWVAGLKKIIQLSGRYISWLALLLVLTEFSVVFLRYVFNWGALWLQDSVVYMHGFLFLLGAAFTFQNDQHVRVDILYLNMSSHKKASVNLWGCLVFVIPLCLFVFITSWPYVMASWKVYEGSLEAGGLPAIFVLKTTLLIFPILLILQAVTTVYDSLQLRKGQQT